MCPQGCGVKTLLKDRADHLKKCLNYKEKCPNCGVDFMPNRTDTTHDCLVELVNQS